MPALQAVLRTAGYSDKVIEMLCRELGLSEEYVRKRVEKYSARERIKSNVDKEIGQCCHRHDTQYKSLSFLYGHIPPSCTVFDRHSYLCYHKILITIIL